MKSSLVSWFFLMAIYSLFFNVFLFIASGQCLSKQQNLLLQLKNNLSFDYDTSTKLVTWNQRADCCSWGGITCSGGHVIGLDLTDESISSNLDNSSNLFNLSSLQSLNLANNDLAWSHLPSAFGKLTNLRYLNLSNTSFGGQIPQVISQLTRLVVLDLSSSEYSSRLENPNLNMLVQNLSELAELYLDGITISAQDNKWCQALSSSLLNLRVLSLSNCDLSSPIDSSLRNLQFLSIIRLSRNNFSITIPKFFSNFKSLTSLNLSSSNLNGKFPKKIFQISTLQELDLSNNNLLQGSLPKFFPNRSLRIMKLEYTNFSRTLPKSIGNLKMLSMINIHKCNFNGSIPKSLARLTKLVYLKMSSNHLNGSIPIFSIAKNLSSQITSTQWENFLNLEVLDLSFNLLDGIIPISLFSLPSLLELRLSNNQFFGRINEFSNGSFSLENLDLSSNNLEGPIPISIFKLQSLRWLSLSSNNFSSSLQNQFFNQINEFSNGSSSLEYLDLSSNNLEGPIPISIFKLQSLRWLSLSSNSFSSSLQNQFFNQINEFSNGSSSLEYLDLSSNNLEGLIPISIFKLRSLKWLSLSSNNFSSSLQLGMTQLRNLSYLNQSILYYLDLSENQIEGKIPNCQNLIFLKHLNLSHNSLKSLEGPFTSDTLTIIDLHSNQLRGQLPIFPFVEYLDVSNNNFSSIALAEISSAFFVSFSSNMLYGSIPKSICNAKNLKVLDLSNNSLDGTIPQCLIELSSTLTVLNLGSNKLNGTISDMFSHNCQLRTLTLNENQLEGELPKSLANCSMMEVLDVRSNNIEGSFPFHLKNISTMRVLILRSNKFHGYIPHLGHDANWSMLQILDLASNNFRGRLSAFNFSTMRAMKGEDKAKSKPNYLQYNHSGYSSSVSHQMSNIGATSNSYDFPLVPYEDVRGSYASHPATGVEGTRNQYASPSFYYQDVVTITVKGSEVKLQKILTVFTILDFSCNNFDGSISEEIGELKLLYALNLSHNVFWGPIPPSLGKLTYLESLDLSSNSLIGKIPEQLADGLIFLSVLNLSFNQLERKIPRRKQFLTFENTSFEGNTALCGFPLSLKCTNEEPQLLPPTYEEAHLNSKCMIDWNYISVELGYVFGLGIVILPLMFWKKWRVKYYQSVDNGFFGIFPQLYLRGNYHRGRALNNQRLRH